MFVVTKKIFPLFSLFKLKYISLFISLEKSLNSFLTPILKSFLSKLYKKSIDDNGLYFFNFSHKLKSKIPLFSLKSLFLLFQKKSTKLSLNSFHNGYPASFETPAPKNIQVP